MTMSRREFFGQAPAGAVASLIAAESPPRAWIILQQGWEHNDEFSYPAGELAHSTLYYDRAAAEAACRQWNDEFYAEQTPAEFDVDWSLYFPEGLPEDLDEASVTWDHLKEAGWEDPYSLRELTIPGVSADE